MTLRDEKGYTLLEIIITMGLIALAIGFSGFGLNVIFNANVNGFANDIANDIRMAATREIATDTATYDFPVIFSYDTAESRYVLISNRVKVSDGSVEEIERVELHSTMTVEKDGTAIYGAGSFNVALAERTIEFDPLTGALKAGSTAGGTYTIKADNSAVVRKITVESESGRVYVEE